MPSGPWWRTCSVPQGAASRHSTNVVRWWMPASCHVVRSGCAWRMLPHSFPPWTDVYKTFRRWSEAGKFETMHDRLRAMWRERQGRHVEPTAAVLDSQSVKTSPQGGVKGFEVLRRQESEVRSSALPALDSGVRFPSPGARASWRRSLPARRYGAQMASGMAGPGTRRASPIHAGATTPPNRKARAARVANGFRLRAPGMSPWSSARPARVEPQVGQGTPVSVRRGHAGMMGAIRSQNRRKSTAETAAVAHSQASCRSSVVAGRHLTASCRAWPRCWRRR